MNRHRGSRRGFGLGGCLKLGCATTALALVVLIIVVASVRPPDGGQPASPLNGARPAGKTTAEVARPQPAAKAQVVARITDKELSTAQIRVHSPWEVHWWAKEGDLRILAYSFGWKEPTVEEIKPFDNLHPDLFLHSEGLSCPTMDGIVRTGDRHRIRIENGGGYRVQGIPEYGDDKWWIEVVQLP